MIKYNGKIFRNIQEQVAKNMEDIAILKQYEGYMGPYATTSAIPEEDLNQDWLYLIGNEAPYTLYKYNANGTFTELGLFPFAGPKGDTGNPGPQGVGIVSITKTGTSGLVDYYTITLSNGQTSIFNVKNGANGADGISIVSITKTGTIGLVDTYTITLSNGQTSTFTVTNGEKGDTGAAGVSIVSITKTGTSGLVDTYTITLSNGQTSTFTVTNGARGPEGQKQIYHHNIFIARVDTTNNTYFRLWFECYNYYPTEMDSIVDLCSAYANPPSGTKILASVYSCSGHYKDSNNHEATIEKITIQGSYIQFDTGIHLVAGMEATVNIPVDDTLVIVQDSVTAIHDILA
ncbi:MAG: hypothetical protein IKF82_07435 [Bacilli bacterium]|nr:hypothetical protein [Bacilli bacterium]